VATRFELFPAKADRAAADAAEDVCHLAGIAVQARATDLVHVVTGRLRTSIDYEVVRPGIEGAPATAYIGSEVDYAAFEEVLHPFLRPALDALRGLTYAGGSVRRINP
jgi:hypothetical protein